jgi:Acyl-CoA carboxylase epsilon subunit
VTPQVRVLRGAPDDVELAALVAGIAAGCAPAAADPRPRRRRQAETRRRWRDGALRLRDPLTPGPDAWRWSGRTETAR